MSAKVIFMGPLPPPVNGFSLINDAMLGLLRREARVLVFNVSPITMKYGSMIARMLRVLLAPVLLARFLLTCLGGGSAFYLGLSGGRGQLFDSVFVLIARVFGLRVYVHHHSFAYLNHARWFNRLTFRICGPAEHVVLCEDMGKAIASIYGIAASRITVLSNVAFMAEEAQAGGGEGARPITLGYISNITAEKGIFEFFALYDLLLEDGFAVAAKIAGPVGVGIEERFGEEVRRRPGVHHLGPVYGPDKSAFYRSIDILVFPTKYVNEAEPLVLWEAMGHGAMVVSIARGCIACSVPVDAGIVASSAGNFLDVSRASLAPLLARPDALMAGKQAAYRHFCQSRAAARVTLDALVKRIAH